MRLIALVAIIVIALLIAYGISVYKSRQQKKYEIKVLPSPDDGEGMAQVHLCRGKDQIQVGQPFASYDEARLDEYTLDAERLRKRLTSRR